MQFYRDLEMSSLKQPRKRAVRLTPGAIKELEAALFDRWSQSRTSRKLTRSARALMMGVSEVTADKILLGEGVDRATLTQAYRHLGLAWADTHCESVSGSEPVCESPPLDITPKVSTRRTKLLVGFSAILVFGSIVPLVAFRVLAPQPRMASVITNPDSELTLHDCVRQGTELFQQAEFDAAQAKLRLATNMARELNAGSELANSLRLTGDVAAAKGDLRAALKLYEQSLDVRVAFKEEASIPPILEAMGDVETRIGNYVDAQNHLNRSLELYSKFNDPVGVALVSRNLGTLAHKRQDLPAAEKWFEAGLQGAKSLGKREIEMDISARKALLLSEQGRSREARLLLEQCLRFWMGKRHTRWVAVTEQQLGTVSMQCGDHEKARAHFLRSRAGYRKVKDKAGLAESERNLKLVPPSHDTPGRTSY